MIIARSTVQSITKEELNMEATKVKIDQFDLSLMDVLSQKGPETPYLNIPYISDQEEDDMGIIEPMEAEASMPEADMFEDIEELNNFISAQVILPRDGTYQTGKVITRKRDANGVPIGRRNMNPILDTSVYEVQFQDGSSASYAANVIAEAVYAQVDDEGKHYLIIDDIIDYRKEDNACRTEDMWITSKNGNKHPRMTTKGWKLCVLWKDGSTSWVPLKDLKESNPIEVAEFAVAQNIQHEPAFMWWVPKV
jgi:hypothetical protein